MITRRIYLCFLAIWMAIGLAACTGTTVVPTPVVLRVAGAASMEPLLQDLAQAFTQQHPDIRIDFRRGNSQLGLDLLDEGKVTMAAVSWVPSDMPESWMATPIAWDGIAIVVHPKNPLKELTMLQLRQLFAGWAFRWQDVGAPMAREDEDSTIVVLSREEGSGTRALFEQRVMGEERVTLTALVMPSGQAVIDYIADHRDAIGYVSMGLVDDRVKVLPIEGLLPTPETVRSGMYHLAQPLYLVTPDRPSGLIQAFIDFILSPEGQAIVGQRYGRIR